MIVWRLRGNIPNVWNSLPVCIVLSKSVVTFTPDIKLVKCISLIILIIDFNFVLHCLSLGCVVSVAHGCYYPVCYPAIRSIGRDTKFTAAFFIHYVQLRISQPGLYQSASNFARLFVHISDRFSLIWGG